MKSLLVGLSLSFFIMGNVYASNSSEYICITKNNSIIHFTELDHEVEIEVIEDRGDIADSMHFDLDMIIPREYVHTRVNRVQGQVHSEDIGDWKFVFNRRSKVLKVRERAWFFPYSTILKAVCNVEVDFKF